MTPFRLVCGLCAVLAVPCALTAQQAKASSVDATNVQADTAVKKSVTLRGVVESVDAKAGRVTVNHGKVEGWMGAMTMAYPVDKPEQLQELKPGDHIEAMVYQDEYK